jgi:hypothetical protein
VPRSLTEEHKEQRKIICSELLARYEAKGDYLLSTIVTDDETWIHHFEPRRKVNPWSGITRLSSEENVFKAIPAARR